MDSKESSSSGKAASVVAAGDEPIGSISARGSAGAGLSMESYLNNFQQQQHSHVSSPPVAMSLRVRETSSRALKHIYEQQIMNGASSREQEFKSAQRQHTGGFQGMRNQSMPDLCKHMPDLDLAFKKDNVSSFPQRGFGSPISMPTHQSSLPQAPLPPMNSPHMQHNYLPQTTTGTRLNASNKQPTGQMTIFYSGNVNVYDDVPADKAHAIMLLAGNSWSSSFKTSAPPTMAPVVPTETMTTRERPLSPIKATPAQHVPTVSTHNNGGGIAKNFASPTPVVSVATTTLASPSPSPALQAPTPLVDAIKSPQVGAGTKRSNAGIELPHARKASLARFLEKRKDRVQVQQQEQQGGAGSEKGGAEITSCDDNPQYGKKQCTHLSSPSCSNNSVKGASNNARDGSPIKNEHRFFH